MQTGVFIWVAPPSPPNGLSLHLLIFAIIILHKKVDTKLCMVILQINGKITSLVPLSTSLSMVQHYKIPFSPCRVVPLPYTVAAGMRKTSGRSSIKAVNSFLHAL